MSWFTSSSEPITTMGMRKVVSARSQSEIASTPKVTFRPKSGIQSTVPTNCISPGRDQSKLVSSRIVTARDMVLVNAE